MIIDVHHHYADGAYYREYTDFPAQLVDAMDRNGWDWVCLNGLGARYHNLGNAAVVTAMSRFPNRIIGVGHLDVDRDGPEQVDALRDMGMRGLKIIGTLKRHAGGLLPPAAERPHQLVQGDLWKRLAAQ